MSTQYLDCDDLKLAYRLLNEGADHDPVLMIMGWTGVKEDWRSLAAALAERHPTVVFDNRGMGESTITEGPYTIAQLAADARRLLDHLGWEKAHVVGISMGGMIAQQLALDAPERVHRLVLGCTMHGGTGHVPPDAETLAGMQISGPVTDPRDILRATLRINFTEAWIAADPARFERIVENSLPYRRSRRGLFAQLQAILEFDLEHRIGEIQAPTLVVHGTGDRLIPCANAEKIASRIPDSRLLTLPDAGHLFWDMDEGRAAREILEFFAEHRLTAR